jgi:hypothetical protein
MSQALKQPSFDPAGSPRSWLLLCAFLALHRVGELAGGESAHLLEAFGLLRPVVECFEALAASESKEPASLSPRAWGDLLQVLLRHERFLAQCQELGAARSCVLLAEDPAVADFLQLHESGGEQWFNKERFEMLLGWFTRLSPFAEGALAEPEAGYERLCELLLDSAAAAGYRLDHFTKLLKDRTE